MWFKNLTIYQLIDVPNFNELEHQLHSKPSRPCGKTETDTIGWISPYTNAADLLSHIVNGYALLCACKEERLLPATVVKEAVEERIARIAELEGREVFRKEKQRIKDEMTFELLPKAFTRKSKTWLYFDKKNKLLVVDTSSPARAEGILTLLRDTLGSLQALPLVTEIAPGQLLTDWVSGKNCPAAIEIADQCEMIDPLQEGAVIRCDKQDLYQEEIQTHLKAGKRIRKVALSWDDKLSFVIDETLSLRKMRALSIITTIRKETHAETEDEQLDADFSLMTLEFAELIKQLIEYMGGLSETKSTESDNKLKVIDASKEEVVEIA